MKKIKSLIYKEKWAAVLLAGPGVFWLTFWVILPFLFAVGYSFTNRTLVINPKLGTSFVGLKNYIELFQDGSFLQSFWNTLRFTIMAVPIQCTLAIFLAVLLNNKVRGIGFFRLIYFMPLVIPILVVSITWSLLFKPDDSGFINSVISLLTFGHVEGLKWLYSADTAMISIVILSVWAGVGLQTIVILAGLQSVDGNLYEAAVLDGAGTVQKFWYVTIPGIKNTLIFVYLSSTIMSFKLFTQILVLTQGGPLNSTTSVVYKIYTTGYIDQRIGYASSMSVVFFIGVLLLSLVQQKFTKMTSD